MSRAPAALELECWCAILLPHACAALAPSGMCHLDGGGTGRGRACAARLRDAARVIGRGMFGGEARQKGVAAAVDAKRRGLRVVPEPERHESRRRRDGVAERRATIAVGLADVRRMSDAGSELVTQAYLGTPAWCQEERDGWTRVRLPDYTGWVLVAQLGAPARWRPRAAVVTARSTPIYAAATGDETLDRACVSTVVPLVGWTERSSRQRIQVALAAHRLGWLASEDVALRSSAEPFPRSRPEIALDFALSLCGTPYLWGGTSPAGIDCSGLAQLSYRVAGYVLPRDADQQYHAVLYLVERGNLWPGDLVFFAEGGAITHVGLSLGSERLVHASGAAGRVTINSLDPALADYSPRLAAMYAGARRPMPFPPEVVTDATGDG